MPHGHVHKAIMGVLQWACQPAILLCSDITHLASSQFIEALFHQAALIAADSEITDAHRHVIYVEMTIISLNSRLTMIDCCPSMAQTLGSNC